MGCLSVRTVTVIGANGTMGRNISAIFASFGQTNVYMVCRTLDKAQAAKEKAVSSVRAESIKAKMIPADYSMLEQCIENSDIVFESSAESWEIKSEITKKIAQAAEKHIETCKNTVFCTGSSGLSVSGLAEIFPEALKGNYMGVHFFNPPYAMPLCEMIPTKYSDRNFFESVKNYCQNKLYRVVVEVKDHPAFLGNRIGFQFINEALQYAERYKDSGGIDYIDAILGPFTGRSMAPLVTSNYVGLDVHKAIVDNLYANTNDYAHETFSLPSYVEELIAEGNLGRKSGAGLYKTVIHDSGAKIHQVYDIATGVYRNVIHYTFPFVEAMIDSLRVGDYSNAFQLLKENHSQEADICMHFLISYILYSVSTAEYLCDSVHAADDVMASGFNWCPPLALARALMASSTEPLKEFENLCLERFDSSYLNLEEIHHLISIIEPSKYDYRKYLKAKR